MGSFFVYESVRKGHKNSFPFHQVSNRRQTPDFQNIQNYNLQISFRCQPRFLFKWFTNIYFCFGPTLPILSSEGKFFITITGMFECAAKSLKLWIAMYIYLNINNESRLLAFTMLPFFHFSSFSTVEPSWMQLRKYFSMCMSWFLSESFISDNSYNIKYFT